ncbi:X-Pro dipeptidyl-peptidase C-terminal non-catalytic domain-containing protein [Leptodontidium sp. 2 PMI_412]|nr:X-Pro dipeptidyl-peptidase C-terminal non-catalytic domain-containing protein [Leptodontidium sp. MPI-SDFR-AT-0119]KAH9223691.1 X-Pro dipeptidyl-peptidase C-terminal non-catalytic domain-containing protein [Leptodontidium sp. 2 PMI_412]
MSERGTFSDVVGFTYRCGTAKAEISSDYSFNYEPKSPVHFLIGNLEIGHSFGKPLLTISDLMSIDTPEFDARLVNRARLLYSLTPGEGFEQPIVIDSRVRDAVNKFASQINLDSPKLSDLDGPLSSICSELKLSPKSVSHTRNHLRREAAGFKVLRDVHIPTRNGEHVLGDVYLPLQHQLGETYPVLLSCTIYGRRVFHSGPNLDDADEILAFEKAEDDWHSASTDVPIQLPRGSWGPGWEAQRGFENIATFNTFSYVPHGYAMVKIDPRGVSQTPGARGVPGQLPEDFFDAVEWASTQSWSDGSSALVGSSYGANTQWNVASMRPKGLKCFVPYGTDLDLYREAAYTGGIPTHRYLDDWFARVQKSSPKWPDHMDLLGMMKSHPFHDAVWQSISTRTDQHDLPCFLAAPQIFIIHGRGAFEAWRIRRPENTHLQLVDCNYYAWASREASGKILQFLGRHLKGSEYPNLERVGIQMRLGYNKWYWRKENNWPVPGTQYTKWHLGVDGGLSTQDSSGPEKAFSYSSKTALSGKSGVSFISTAFETDVEFAGHFKAVLSISSSSSDADVAVSLWAVSPDGVIVPYSSAGLPEPLAKGFLRASHRKTDPTKSLPERPWHTHTQADNALLNPDEVVELEIEIFPAAGRVRKGWKLRVDVSPSEHQPDIPGYSPVEMRVWYGEGHDEGTNTVHVGGDRANYIYCPVVPLKEEYPNII